MHQEELLIADFELLAGVAGEEDSIAGLDLERLSLAVVGELAVADADDGAAGRLVLGGVGQEDAAAGAGFGFLALDDDAVTEGLQTGFGFRFGFGSSSAQSLLRADM